MSARRKPPQRTVAERNALVTANLRLAYKVAGRHRARVAPTLSNDEAVSACLMGLVSAAAGWDPAIAKFSTYAWMACLRHLQREGRADRLIAVPINLPPEERAAQGHWERQAGDKHLLPGYGPHEPVAPPAPDPCLSEDMERCLRWLSPRHRHVVLEHTVGGRSLAVVGRELGVSKERVRQIEAEALARLRDKLGGDR